MKKYLVVLLVIPLLLLSIHKTEASFFGDIWNGLFGSSVPAASQPAKAANFSTTDGTTTTAPDTTFNPAPTTSGGGGTVTTPVTTTPAPAAPCSISSLTAASTSIVSGSKTNISWVLTGGCTSIVWNGETVAATASLTRTVAPLKTTTYTLSAIGINGKQTKSVTVAVTQKLETPITPTSPATPIPTTPTSPTVPIVSPTIPGGPIDPNIPVRCNPTAGPILSVLSQNSGEVYQAGQQVSVKWSSCTLPTNTMVGVSISAYSADGANLKASTELKMVPNNGTTTFTLPAVSYDSTGNPYISLGSNGQDAYKAPVGKYFKVGIKTSTQNSGVITDNSNLFTINAPVIQPQQSIMVTSPNGGEELHTGDTDTITWKSTGFTSTDLVDVEVISVGTDGGLQDVIKENIPVTDNNFAWKIPANFYTTPNRTYKVCVGNVGGAYVGTVNINDCSDKTFTIINTTTAACPISGAPSITVLSPNGGEVYHAGQQMTVKWTSCNIPASDTVVINEYSDQSSNGTVGIAGYAVKNTGQNDGASALSLDTLKQVGWTTGKHFKISVSHYLPNSTTTDAVDQSDNLFTINDNSVSVGCLVNSLTANPATINSGDSSKLSWTTSGCASVAIETAGSDPRDTHAKNGYSWVTGNKWGMNDSVKSNFYSTTNVTLTASDTAGCYGAPFSNVNGQPCAYVSSLATVTVGTTTDTCPISGASGVTITTPAGGETFITGKPMIVHWTSCHIDANANVRLSIAAYDALGQDWKADVNPVTVFNSAGTATLAVPWASFDAPDGVPYILMGSSGQTKYNAPLGKYYKVTISAPVGNTNVGNSSPLFSIAVPSPTEGCTNKTIYSPITGQPCPVYVPVTKNGAYPNRLTNQNVRKVKMGSWVLNNKSSVQNVRITNLQVGLNTTVGLSNLVTGEFSGSGSNPINPTTLNNFSVDFTIPAGKSKTIDIYADVGSVTPGTSYHGTLLLSGVSTITNGPIVVNAPKDGQLITVK